MLSSSASVLAATNKRMFNLSSAGTTIHGAWLQAVTLMRDNRGQVYDL